MNAKPGKQTRISLFVPLAAWALFIATACAAGDKADDDDGAGECTDCTDVACAGSPDCATPTTGDYLFEEVSTTTDCPEVEDTGGEEAEAEPVHVTVNADKTTVTLFEAEFPLDGTAFEGELYNIVTDYNETASLDAVTTYHSDLAGQWVSSSKITGTTTSDSSCEGEYCADFEAAGATFCTATVEWEATLEE
jgi:hypothetical protein